MDQKMQFPGLQNAWTMPIRARIDMLSTGIRTPVGIKIFGPDLNTIQDLGIQIEGILKEVPGTRSVYAERVAGGFFIDIDIQRDAIARYGLTVGEVQEVIQSAIGGMNITRTIEGRERYPVNVRYPRELRDDVEKLKRIQVPARMGGAARMEPGGAAGTGMAQIPLAQLADIRVTTGPAMIRDEDAMLGGYVFIDVTAKDIGGYVEEAKRVIAGKAEAPGRLFPLVERPVRIPAARQGTAEDPAAGRLFRDLHPALHDVSLHIRVGHPDDRRPLRHDRRRDPAVSAGLQLQRGRLGGLHRPLRDRRGNRRGDDHLSARGPRPPPAAGADQRCRISSRPPSKGRCCGCGRRS